MFFLSSLVKQTPIYPFVGEDASSILYSSFRITFKKALGEPFFGFQRTVPQQFALLKEMHIQKEKNMLNYK